MFRVFLCLLPFTALFAQPTAQQALQFSSNPHLATILPNWKGTPIDENGRFMNHEFPFRPRLSDVLKWNFSKKPQKLEKKQDTFRLATQQDRSFLTDSSDCILWLGHASFFIRLNGVSLLIDPLFFKVPFVKRYVALPFEPEIFQHLDYVLISHDHQDHCQKKSVQAILKNNPQAKILTGLNMESLLEDWVKGTEIQTAGWYQQYETNGGIRICFLPSRHWAKRSLNDDNRRLWGAFVIQSGNKTIYFSGDTGYGSHFKQAQTLFPHFDVAIIGVGAYKPEWFMAPNHISPTDAVKAFGDLGAKVMIPMHYGTLDLSDEPVGEPYRILKALEKEGKIPGTLKALDLGENYRAF